MKNNKFFSFVSLSLLLFTTISIQVHFLNQRYPERILNPDCPWCEESQGEDVVFIPINASIARLFAPADHQFLAELFWMRTAYYFGKHTLSDKVYPYLTHLLDLVSDLSPSWVYPYIYGAVIFSVEADATDDGFYFISKGLIHHPDSWRLWFYKGYYLWKYHDDKLSAAEAFHTGANLEGAPIYLARLAATFATQAGRRELGIRFLLESIKNSQDPELRKSLQQKLEEIRKSG